MVKEVSMSGHESVDKIDSLEQGLGQAPVFSSLDPASRSQVARLAVRKEYRKGTFVFHQEEVWPFALYLVAGRLEWSLLSPEGRRQALFDPVPGDVVWGHSFFDGQPMPGSLEALETSVTYQWDRESLRPILSRSSAALWELTRGLVGSMRRVREIVYSFAFLTVSGRVARFLLMHYPFQEGQVIPRTMTLEEMAAHVGSTPALVCKTLYTLAEKGYIRLTRTDFEFVDRLGLEQLAYESR